MIDSYSDYTLPADGCRSTPRLFFASSASYDFNAAYFFESSQGLHRSGYTHFVNAAAILLALRHEERALLNGDYVALNQDNPDVLSYLRRYKDEAVLVVLNMSATPQQVSFDLSSNGFPSPKATTVLSGSTVAPNQQLDQVPLEPLVVYIARVSG